MKTFRFIGFILSTILLCSSACSGGGDDDPIEPTPKPEVIKSEITIDSSIISNGLSFTNEKGEQSISFSTNESWTLSVASTTSGTTWCTASATSGSKGTATVQFDVAENTTYDNRSVSVTIKSGTVSKTFTIFQKGVDITASYTDGVVTIAKAGTLSKLLGNEYLAIPSLKVIGTINGDDIRCLRQMLGGYEYNNGETGILTTLELSEASIVKGGEFYYKQNYTSNDIIGDYMFYKCYNLQNIVLPNNVTSIGFEAFSDCI